MQGKIQRRIWRARQRFLKIETVDIQTLRHLPCQDAYLQRFPSEWIGPQRNCIRPVRAQFPVDFAALVIHGNVLDGRFARGAAHAEVKRKTVQGFENVPVDDQGSEVDWELRPDGSNAVSLGPYPFRREPLQVSILTRKVPKRLY